MSLKKGRGKNFRAELLQDNLAKSESPMSSSKKQLSSKPLALNLL
jgi:hypothetical protein